MNSIEKPSRPATLPAEHRSTLSAAVAQIVAATELVTSGDVGARPAYRRVGVAWIGVALAFILLTTFDTATGWPLVLGSFGASCALIFAYPDGPFSRPRNVIGGHVLCSLVGLVSLHALGAGNWGMAFAAATGVAAMMLTDTMHPPAASNTVIIFLMQPDWAFLLFPTATGAVILVLAGIIYRHAMQRNAAAPSHRSSGKDTSLLPGKQINVFLRQPFTEAGDEAKQLIGEVMSIIDEFDSSTAPFNYLTSKVPEAASTFAGAFENTTGKTFTPTTFRDHRIELLRQADLVINIRVAMSESTAFELAYHAYHGARTPVLFLVWDKCPIKTTLLRELGAVCPAHYMQFSHAEDLRAQLSEFFSNFRNGGL